MRCWSRSAIITIAVSTTCALALTGCGLATKQPTVAPLKPGPITTNNDDRRCDAPGADGKPPVFLPSAPVTELLITDNKVGTGLPIRRDSEFSANFIGCGQHTRQQFESSWDIGEPGTFAIKTSIAGWAKGLLGMRVGGRRTLTIPGALGYGPNPASPDIKPNETLVYVIDLVSVKRPPNPKVLAAVMERGKPTIALPIKSSTDIVVTDDIVGTGPAVKAESTVLAHYLGVGATTRAEFLSSWALGHPIEFQIKTLSLTSWAQSLVGMRVGGRRTVVLPGTFAYGDHPPDPKIKPNETLILVVDLIQIT